MPGWNCQLALRTLVLSAGLCACSGERSRVQYVSDAPKGKWYQSEARAEQQPTSDAAAEVMQAQPAAGRDSAAPSSEVAGRGGSSADGGRTSSGASGSAGSSQGGAASTQAGRDAVADPGVKVTLQFTTVTQHMGKGGASCTKGDDGMSYGPCNLGAAWVTTPSGELVKVVNQWGKSVYTKHLVRYQAELADVKPDVMVTATLKANGPHSVTWDHTDQSGAFVPAGAYKLVVEVADFDTMKIDGAKNAVLELAIDTRQRKVPELMDTQYYTDLELRYQ